MITDPLQNSNQVRGESFDLGKWMLRIVKLTPWFLLSFLICLSAAWIYLRHTEPVYKSSAFILIKDEKSDPDPLLKELNISGSGKVMENEIEVLKSPDLMDSVTLKEQLYVNITSKGAFFAAAKTHFRANMPILIEVVNPYNIYNIISLHVYRLDNQWYLATSEKGAGAPLSFSHDYNAGDVNFRFVPNPNYAKKGQVDAAAGQDFFFTLTPVYSAARVYNSALHVEQVGKMGSVISLSMEDKNAEKVSSVLRTLISIYNARGLDDKNVSGTNTMKFLDERLAVVEKDLKGVEGEVEQFKTRHKVSDISAESQQYMQLSAEIDKQKAIQQTQVNIVSDLERELIDKKDNPSLVPSTLGITESSLASLIQRHNELIINKERIQNQAGPNNPLLLDLQNQIENVRKSLLENVHNLKNAYTISLNDIARKDAELGSRISTMPQLEKDLIQIKRNQGVQEQLYLFLLQMREQRAMMLASNITDTRTIVEPRSMGQTKPSSRSIWTIAFSLALMLPVLVVVLLDFMDNKVTGKSEVEQKTIIPLLGEIAFVSKKNHPIVVSQKVHTRIAEQFRVLRTAISFSGKTGVKRILVTSQSLGEGKSFVSLNLGATYALLNKKVVVLEFDLRRASISNRLHLDGDKGISGYLTDRCTIDDALIPVPDTGGNLFIMPAGGLYGNPAELVMLPEMEQLMKELESRFDYIIIDTPPFSMVTDATLLQQYADITIVVLRQGYSLKQAYHELNVLQLQSPGHPFFTVLNATGKQNLTYKYETYSGNSYYEQKNNKYSLSPA
ncbi:MAG: polysaccharide biosynthesis tyrosine autokinase [Chitinophagaceae bacterium]